METSIQISRGLMEKLRALKLYSKESYEEVIWELIEDRMELSEDTKKNIAISEDQMVKREIVSLEEIKRKNKL